MGQFDKYYLYKKQRAVSGTSNWEDVITATGLIYSIDGDGTMPLVLAEADSPDCGYQPIIEPQYRWINLNPLIDYYCDECPTYKFQATYGGGQTYSAECDSGIELTSADTRPSGYQYTAMTSAVIGDCIRVIGINAFCQYSGLTSVTIGSDVRSIGGSAFVACTSLQSINIPNSVTYIGDVAFLYCIGLTSLNIGSAVTYIGASAFHSCSGLTNITIPSSVREIGDWAFSGCTRLTSITCLATTPPTLGTDVLLDTNNCPIYVPSGSVNAYKSAWSTYSSRIQAIS